MDLVAAMILELQPVHRAADCGRIVPPVMDHPLVGFQRLKVAEQVGVVRQHLPLVPGGGLCQHPHGVNRLPFPLRHDSQIAAVPYGADDARHALRHVGIDIADAGAIAGRTHDAGMDHTG